MPKIYLLFLIAVYWPAKLSAQPAPDLITAREALAYAEENSPVLGRLRAIQSAEKARRLGAVGIANPQIIYAREGIANGSGGFAEQRWMIQQSVDSPVETIFRLKQLSSEREALIHRIETERVALRERVKLAYLEFWAAHARVRLRRQGVVLSDSLIRIVDLRIQAGDAAELDRLRIELERVASVGDLDVAERMREAACGGLLQAMGRPAEGDSCRLSPADSLSYTAASAPDALPAFEVNLPAMAAANASLDAARFGVRKARGSLWPRLHINYWPQDFGAGYDFHGFEVGFSVPLWSMFNQKASIAQARVAEQQWEWTRQEVSVTLEAERSQAWNQHTISRAALERFVETINARAATTLVLTRRGYELGELGLLALLDMQRTFIDVRIRFQDALKTYYEDLIRLEKFLPEEVVF